MIPKQYRLPSFIIPHLVQKGKRVHGDMATLIVLSTLNLKPYASQIAIIVPQRLSKKATERNRTKRLLVEALHQQINSINPGFQIIVMAKKILEKEKLQDVLTQIKELLRKANLLKK